MMKEEAKKTNVKPFIIAAVPVIIAVLALTVYSIVTYDGEAALCSYLAKGSRYLVSQDYEKAIKTYNSAVKLAPRDPDGYFGLAVAYVALGDEEKASDALRDGYRNTGAERLDGDLKKLQGIGQVSVKDPDDGEDPGKDPDPDDGSKPTGGAKPTDGAKPTEDPGNNIIITGGYPYDAQDYALMQTAYTYMSAGDYTEMKNVDGTTEAENLVSHMPTSSVVFDANGLVTDPDFTGNAAGVYVAPDGGYYFFYGEYKDGVREGKGTTFWNTGYNGEYEIFQGEYSNDAPNGFGRDSWYSPNYDFVKKGNYVNGVEDGHFTMDVSWANGASWSSPGYDASMGDAPLPSNIDKVNMGNGYDQYGNQYDLSSFADVYDAQQGGMSVYVVDDDNGAFFWYDPTYYYLAAPGYRSR